MLSQDVSSPRGAGGPATAQAWDPYDVWLKRVKQPRDLLPQRNVVAGAPVGPVEAESRAETPALVPRPT